ncbi:hypothetical protein GCM10023205_63780 [Yinghuangia aomiensis]|uniref:Uncharacterized protein n=1 Tax=Yinghuangia aomiensis TaxID=676205 RepID=A0ABP9I238_9ACTN
MRATVKAETPPPDDDEEEPLLGEQAANPVVRATAVAVMPVRRRNREAGPLRVPERAFRAVPRRGAVRAVMATSFETTERRTALTLNVHLDDRQ